MVELIISWLILLIYLFVIIGFACFLWKKKLYVLHPGRALYQEPLFWAASLTPLLSGFYFGLWVWFPSGLQIDKEGFENFLEVSKLPLGIMALGIPFGVMVGSFHRTLQTAEQIELTRSNNNFRNGFDHRNLFIEKCENKLPERSAAKAHIWHEFIFSDAIRSGVLGISLKSSDFARFDFHSALFDFEPNYRKLLLSSTAMKVADDAMFEQFNIIFWVGFEQEFLRFCNDYSYLFESLESPRIADKLNEFCSFYEIACELNFSDAQSVEPWFCKRNGSRFISVKKENGFTNEMLEEMLSDYGYLSEKNKDFIKSEFESNGELRSYQGTGLYLVSKQLHDKLIIASQNP